MSNNHKNAYKYDFLARCQLCFDSGIYFCPAKKKFIDCSNCETNNLAPACQKCDDSKLLHILGEPQPLICIFCCSTRDITFFKTKFA